MRTFNKIHSNTTQISMLNQPTNQLFKLGQDSDIYDILISAYNEFKIISVAINKFLEFMYLNL